MRPTIERARELRRNMSEPEVILWSRLKRLRERGYAFRRQFPFRGYYLDFACLSFRLIVEVDGHQHSHEPQAQHDAVRDRIAERHGFRVLRFTASEVRGNLGGVMDHIIRTLEETERVKGVARSATSAPEHHALTLAASPPVPPHQGREGDTQRPSDTPGTRAHW
jgi:very-short-patch-repair endonuclease